MRGIAAAASLVQGPGAPVSPVAPLDAAPAEESATN